MAEQPQYGVLLPPDPKRRRLDGESTDISQTTADKAKGAVDKAKANYLSGQLRLRLQYAKLKVEHGWQRQTLSEVENLYFRHTHLTRPYPVISPGGRRNGRTLSTNGVVTGTSQTSLASLGDGSGQDHPGAQANSVSAPGTSSRLGPNGSSGSTYSSSSTDVTASATVPSTPTIDGGRVTTPHAPHIGSGNAATRYPMSRSDSTATVIMESVPSLGHPQHSLHESPSAASRMAHENGTSSTFREPFDPMEPTEHIDSQLAALRSMMSSTSAMPPPPSQATSSAPVLSPSMQTLSHNGPGGGLTYDAFWSTHSSKPVYRALLASHTGVQTTGQARSATPLQAHGSAPAVLTQPSSGAGPRAGHTNGQNYEGRFGR